MINIKLSELRSKTIKKLEEMKKKCEFHLAQATLPKNNKQKGFNINEEKKNIARINTIIKEKQL